MSQTTIRDRSEDLDTAGSPVARRLVVELADKSADDLGWLVDVDRTNKTTVVNRAVQVYRLIAQALREGKKIQLVDDKTGARETVWIV